MGKLFSVGDTVFDQNDYLELYPMVIYNIQDNFAEITNKDGVQERYLMDYLVGKTSKTIYVNLYLNDKYKLVTTNAFTQFIIINTLGENTSILCNDEHTYIQHGSFHSKIGDGRINLANKDECIILKNGTYSYIWDVVHYKGAGFTIS